MTTHPKLRHTNGFPPKEIFRPSNSNGGTLKPTELFVAAENNGMLPHAAVGKNMKHSVHLKLAIS